MKTLHLLLIVFMMTACAYANTAVLVYTINQQTAPWLIESDQNSLTICDVKSNYQMKAALIIDVNTDTFQTIAPNPDQMPVLILLGKNADGSPVNYILKGDANSVRFQIVTMETNSSYRLFATGMWCFVDTNWFLATGGSVGACGEMVDTVIANGSKTKVAVPKTLKGVGTLQRGIEGAFKAGVGDGPFIAALNTPITKKVNADGNGTVQAAVALIEVKKGPTPNPLPWVVSPVQKQSGSSYLHTMQCGEVDNTNPLVQYKFVCLENPSISSAWQEGTSYTVSVGGPHLYRWYAIAKDALGHTTGKGNTVWVRD